MNVHAKPGPLAAETQSSLGEVLEALSAHDDKALVIEYGGRNIQPGYHVTEVKAGSFVTLDCGGNPDAWQETILQVEDLPAGENESFMTVGKFRGILAQVDRKVRLNHDARLTIEIGPPGLPMQVFDVAALAVEGDTATLQLASRSAICKPRHKAAANSASACCAPGVGSSCCG